MKVAVVGLGEFGRSAALLLARNGAEVIAIDADMRILEKVKDQVALAICVDATQEDELSAHGIPEVEVLLACIGESFEAQVLVVVLARKLGIKRIIARAASADHGRILKAVGATEIVRPEEEAARAVVQRSLIPNLRNYVELAFGFSVVEIDAPPGMIGKTLIELKLRQRFRVNLVAIKHQTTGVDGAVVTSFNPVPGPEDCLRAGDTLSLVGSDLDLAQMLGEYPTAGG